MQGMTVRVSDRFGDYGLVGVALYQVANDLLDVDSVLLSCRALGRGVEHQLLREIGKRAQAAGVSNIQLNYAPTAKNTPAREFLNEILGGQILADDTASSHQISPDAAASIAFKARSNVDQSGENTSENVAPVMAIGGDNKLFDNIAQTLGSVDLIIASANKGSKTKQIQRAEVFRAPQNEVEHYLAKLWTDILFVDDVGLDDHFFQLGGHSLVATRVLSQVCNQYGVELPLATLFESPTLGAFAQAVSVARWANDEGDEDDQDMEDGVI
jgi:acyl carrier protein